MYIYVCVIWSYFWLVDVILVIEKYIRKLLYVVTGKYYLVDSTYPNECGFLGPYKGYRYYLQEFRSRGQPQTCEEIFNRVHSSLRNVIEHKIGVWKKKDGEFYRIYLRFLTKRKFRLSLHLWQFIITLEELHYKMRYLWNLIVIPILFPMIF